MTSETQNIFNALFEFRPSDGRTSEENFLTEAFAYILGRCENARSHWLFHILGKAVSEVGEIRTRGAERNDSGRLVIPDMKISGCLVGGERFVLYSEHKWNSPCDPGQLKRYLKHIESDIESDGARVSRLIFIGALKEQVECAESCDSRMNTKSFLWADAFNVFERIQDKPPILMEFLEFMKHQGLDPGMPIMTETMREYVQSRTFVPNLERFACGLSNDFDWSFIPSRYRSDVHVKKEMDRVAIKFATPDWRPGLILGFLHEEDGDLKVKYVDRERGIDLFLRIETNPKNQHHLQGVLRELKNRKNELRKCADNVLLHGDAGNRNNYTVLLVRSCLSSVIEKMNERQDQLQAVYSKLREWGEILFKDGILEKALKESGLDSE